MKNKFCLLLLPSFLVSLAGCNNQGSTPTPEPPGPKQDVDVVIISGQSNGVGCTWCNQISGCPSLGQNKYNEYFVGYSDIQIAFESWTKDYTGTAAEPYELQNHSNGNFIKVTLGQGNGKHSFGPEIGIAEATHETHGGKLFLIKYACGASNLNDDWVSKDTQMYSGMITYIKEQMSNLGEKGYNPTIKAFCWMQGEGDSYYGYYQRYQANTRAFIANIREDLKDYSLSGSEIAFIDAGINNNGARWQYWKQVNEAKQKVAAESEYNFYVDTIGAGMHTNQEPRGNVDADHYDSESEVLLGHLFAETFEPFLMK